MVSKVFADSDRPIRPFSFAESAARATRRVGHEWPDFAPTVPVANIREYHVPGGGLSRIEFADTAALAESECNAAPHFTDSAVDSMCAESFENERRAMPLGALALLVVFGITAVAAFLPA